jgi:hypothetical protein
VKNYDVSEEWHFDMKIFWHTRIRDFAGRLERGEKCLIIISSLHKYEPKKGRENEADQSAYPGKTIL